MKEERLIHPIFREKVGDGVHVGIFYFEIGTTMIDRILLGSILTNIEVAYTLTKIEIEKLQKSHKMGLRKLLFLPPAKTPIKIPIEF